MHILDFYPLFASANPPPRVAWVPIKTADGTYLAPQKLVSTMMTTGSWPKPREATGTGDFRLRLAYNGRRVTVGVYGSAEDRDYASTLLKVWIADGYMPVDCLGGESLAYFLARKQQGRVVKPDYRIESFIEGVTQTAFWRCKANYGSKTRYGKLCLSYEEAETTWESLRERVQKEALMELKVCND